MSILFIVSFCSMMAILGGCLLSGCGSNDVKETNEIEQNAYTVDIKIKVICFYGAYGEVRGDSGRFDIELMGINDQKKVVPLTWGSLIPGLGNLYLNGQSGRYSYETKNKATNLYSFEYQSVAAFPEFLQIHFYNRGDFTGCYFVKSNDGRIPSNDAVKNASGGYFQKYNWWGVRWDPVYTKFYNQTEEHNTYKYVANDTVGEPLKSNASKSITGTYYFAFRKNYNATFTTIDSGNVTNMPATQSLSAGIGYNISSGVPTRPGKTFIGWSDGKVGGTLRQPGDFIPDEDVNGDYFWHANWKEDIHTLYFNSQSGTCGEKNRRIYTGSRYDNNGSLPTPSRQHYKFLGWYDSASGGSPVSGNTIVSRNYDHTLYAHWEKISYTITLDKTEGVDRINCATKVVWGSTVRASASMLPGWDFGGWTRSDGVNYGGNSYSFTMPSRNITLTARSKRHIYYIYYKRNGSNVTGSEITDSVEYKRDYTARKCMFDRNGYSFIGWTENSDGSGSNWTNYIGTPWNWTYTHNINLYAQWKPNDYDIHFNTNGGNSVSSQRATYTLKYGGLPTPTREGCVFAGWYTDNSFSTQITSTSSMERPEDHTLYAKWNIGSGNLLKYDSSKKYYYFEDGYFPQTMVSISGLNTSLPVSRTMSIGGKSRNIYSYSGSEYAYVEGKWFRVEPIRWRISDYGVTTQPSNLNYYGAKKTNFLAVSDKVINVDYMNELNTTEGWSIGNSKLFSNVQSTDFKLRQVSTNTVSMDKFNTNKAEKVVKYDQSNVKVRIVSEEELDLNFKDKRAEASDLVKHLLKISTNNCNYWTRDLTNLNNAKVITRTGTSTNYFMNNLCGVRYSVKFTNGHNLFV